MRSHLLWLCPLLLALALTPAAALAQEPVAVLMSLSGDVTVAHADGSEEAGSFGMHLHDGDEVRSLDSSKAEILFSTGSWIEIGANSSTVVGSRGGGGEPAASESFQTVQRYLQLKDAKGTSSLARLRGEGDGGDLELMSPCQTRILDAHPVFRWEASDPQAELQLTVYSESGVHWRHDVQGVSEIGYPDDAPALQESVSYSWTLESTDPLLFPPLRSSAAFFELMKAEDRQRLQSELSEAESAAAESSLAPHLLRASVFYSHGLLENAIGATRKALEADREHVALRSILAHLYAEMGQPNKALDEYGQIMAPR